LWQHTLKNSQSLAIFFSRKWGFLPEISGSVAICEYFSPRKSLRLGAVFSPCPY
jgi:hypothetical protein